MKKTDRADSRSIANGLGADISCKFFEGHVLVNLYNVKGNLVKEKKIRRLSDKDSVRGLRVIGSASGVDFSHCLYLGIKYSRTFLKKVHAYTMEPDGVENTVTVTFYRKK